MLMLDMVHSFYSETSPLLFADSILCLFIEILRFHILI